ncbi:hypothetical protein KUTeg_017817 [Tegillarca granosa]|uniref:Uncharacterized protein n=1 Tax=Tegillarca granosa TaxID=220873 RepID=A0ABQ9EG17_TEGGR|nr:hypothetical protein KUTeg_017817 [Tegillarca granosa]
MLFPFLNSKKHIQAYKPLTESLKSSIVSDYLNIGCFICLYYSGLLMSYLILKEMKKKKGARGINWGLFYFHRFWRLTPVYMLVLFVNEIVGLTVCILFLIGTTVTSGIVSIQNKLPPSTFGGGEKGSADHNTYSTEYYFKPWCRMGPYIVGILAGYLLYKTNYKLRINKYVNIALWLLTTAMGLAILYGLYDALRGNSTLTFEVSAFYNATHRSAWGICVCWVIVACATGHGGKVLKYKSHIPFTNSFTGNNLRTLIHFLANFSRLYKHIVVMESICSTKSSYILCLPGSPNHNILVFFGFLVSSYLVAFVVSLAFESPMMGLEKVMLGRRSNKKQNLLPVQRQYKCLELQVVLTFIELAMCLFCNRN